MPPTNAESERISSPLRLEVLEADGDVYHYRVSTDGIRFEVIAELRVQDSVLYADGVHISGPGRWSVSPVVLRAAALELGRQWHAERVIIHGGIRTSGASPGRRPLPVIIKVP